ncbi:MAG TPA: LysR substrate-binding domain-containing protein [Methylomirabilota bacterium]|jgi:DNA-binding transcriptional LysR family regulator
MSGYLHRLPRLSALLMFESAARHRSFTQAARELQVTQAAVSQQVRALERELGIALFERLHRGLELTSEGRRLHRAVSMGFEHVAVTTEELRATVQSARVAIGATFAVATFWLVPRLPRFRALYPHIDLHVAATDRGFDKIAHQVDAGIAYGMGHWPGFRSTLLRQGEVFPVCSPEYLRGRPPLAGVEQLCRETLLSIDDDRPGLMDWPLWFAEQGIKGYSSSRNLKINSHPLLMQAACEGQGIALGWALLCDDLLRKGRLVRPLAASVRTPRAFYLVTSERSEGDEVRVFRDWVLAQFPPAAPGAPPRRAARLALVSER